MGKQRSWAASFKFTGKSGAKPYYERFSQGGNNLVSGIEAMRIATAAKRARRTRSWASNIPWPKQSTKKPMFERFEAPPCNISIAVQQMRQQLTKKRVAKKEDIENQVLIEDVDDEDDRTVACIDV